MNREERLRRRRELYRLRRDEETPQEREIRLATRRERERMRRANLSAERRQCILDQRRERYQHTRNLNATPTSGNPIEVTVRAVDDHGVIQKMKEFHEDIGSLEAVRCIICQENFPNLKTNEIGHCTRCHRDTKIPKLYSSENNMHPGPVPPELSVSVFSK